METPKRVKLLFLPGWGGGAADAAPFFSRLPSFVDPICLYNAPVSEAFPTAQNSEALSSALAEIIEEMGEADYFLCGYSMGARVATLVARQLTRSALRGLILLSGGLGFSSEKDRQERQLADARWQALLQQNAQEFWTQWYRQDIFQSGLLSREVLHQWVAERNNLNQNHLAADMARYGAGTHPYLVPILTGLSVPVLYLYGEKDSKYGQLGERVKSSISGATVLHIPGAGHILPLEAPEAVARAISSWIQKI